MSTFEKYYEDLLTWEGVPFTQLISPWNQDDAKSIADDFARAIARSGIRGMLVPIRAGSTNQSIGNQVETFFVSLVDVSLQTFRIIDCPGHGYPDKQLRDRLSGRRFPLELKATSQWNPADSNRRVLTSSSDKVRSNFVAPMCHLLTTVCYEINDYSVSSIRLDFIEPTTKVSVRLEASVNHRLLSVAAHKIITI